MDVNGGGRVGSGGGGFGGQGEWEPRIEAFVKIQKKKLFFYLFFFLGGGGSDQGFGWGRSR